MIHRYDSFRSERFAKHSIKRKTVTWYYNRTLEEVVGDDAGVTGVKDAASGATDHLI